MLWGGSTAGFSGFPFVGKGVKSFWPPVN